MRLPTDIAGYMRTTQKLFVEEGRLEITCVWPDGIKIVADAVKFGEESPAPTMDDVYTMMLAEEN